MSGAQVPVMPPFDPTGPVKAAVGESLKAGATSVIDGFSGWLFESLADLTGSVFELVGEATTPDVTARWFIDGSTGTGPYRAMVTVAASMMVLLVFGGVVQGVASGDLAGMVRRMVLHLPVAVLGMTATTGVVHVLIGVTDELSLYLTATVGADSEQFVRTFSTGAMTGTAPGAPVVVLGIVMLAAALVVFVELLVRSLLIYLIVALSPLAWAALVWPAVQGALRKTLELLLAVILSKVVVALAIAIGAAAFSGTEVNSRAIGPPRSTESLGLLAMGVATFALAAFSPFLLVKLMPFAEAAMVAHGIRTAPVRSMHQAWNLKHQFDMSRRLSGGSSTGGSSASPDSAHGGQSSGGGSTPTVAARASGRSGGVAGEAGGSGGGAAAGAAIATGAVVAVSATAGRAKSTAAELGSPPGRSASASPGSLKGRGPRRAEPIVDGSARRSSSRPASDRLAGGRREGEG